MTYIYIRKQDLVYKGEEVVSVEQSTPLLHPGWSQKLFLSAIAQSFFCSKHTYWYAASYFIFYSDHESVR